MKSSVLILLSMLLTMAILAPSVITLTNIDEKAITLDFNEEEKKEAKEKDLFLDHSIHYLAQQQNEKIAIGHLYVESNYGALLAIFLPPPKQRFS